MRKLVVLPALVWLAVSASLAGSTRPSFIFILTDDQGWSQSSVAMHPSITGSRTEYLETPAMARLAREGMRFSSAYSPAPTCTPSRRSILCGMTPARQRGTEFSSSFDPVKHLTIPRALKAVDPSYRTAHFGKWGKLMGAGPEQVGYDESDGKTTNRHGGTLGGKNKNRPLWRVDPDPKRTPSVTARAIDFIARQVEAKRPFYLQVSYYAIHTQIQTTQATLDKYEKKGSPPRSFPISLAAMTEELDHGIARILDAVDELGIGETTFVFLSSDNGASEYDKENPLFLEQLGDVPKGLLDFPEGVFSGPEGSLPVNHPLRGSKQWLYEGGIRVPMIVRGPGVAAGSWSHVPVALYDLLPTLVELAGDDDVLTAELDGGSLRSLLRGGGEGEVHRPAAGLVFHRPRYRYSALRVGKFKLVLRWEGNGGQIRRELFDVDIDPGEKNNLLRSAPDTADELYGALVSYLTSVDADLPRHVQLDARRVMATSLQPDPG